VERFLVGSGFSNVLDELCTAGWERREGVVLYCVLGRICMTYCTHGDVAMVHTVIAYQIR
jgi:hypothetical protein